MCCSRLCVGGSTTYATVIRTPLRHGEVLFNQRTCTCSCTPPPITTQRVNAYNHRVMNVEGRGQRYKMFTTKWVKGLKWIGDVEFWSVHTPLEENTVA